MEWEGLMGEWVNSYKIQFWMYCLVFPQSTAHFEVNIRGCTCQEMVMARGQAVHKPTDMESGGRILVPWAIYNFFFFLWASMKGEKVTYVIRS